MSTILKQIANLPSADCPECGGTGRIQKLENVGKLLKKLRKSRGVQLREIAKRMGFTPPYICDLEKGRREMTSKLLRNYLCALKNKSK